MSRHPFQILALAVAAAAVSAFAMLNAPEPEGERIVFDPIHIELRR